MKNIKRILLVGFVLTSLNSLFGQNRIIIFTQENSLSDSIFLADYYEPIDSIAKASQLDLVLRDVADGAPDMVTRTPLILFQNPYSTIPYYGRYNNVDRMSSFFRTARRLRSDNVIDTLANKLAWSQGRLNVLANIKITPLSGAKNKELQQEFHDLALSKVKTSFLKYEEKSELYNQKTDRAYYFDIYPYLDSLTGTYYLSGALFSQFNCIDPIFVTDSPVQAPRDHIAQGLKSLVAMLENASIESIQSSTLGDDSSPVHTPFEGLSYDDLGLTLEQDNSNAGNTDLLDDNALKKISHWTYHGPVDAYTPAIAFHFLSPLDSYAGEAKPTEGQLDWSAESISGINGKFIVHTSSVTMGDPSLDQAIYTKILKSIDYPAAALEVTELVGDIGHFRFGEEMSSTFSGDFTMMGQDVLVRGTSFFEPIIDETGEIKMRLLADFEANVTRAFGIEGPYGDPPANEVVQFDINILMSPVYYD